MTKYYVRSGEMDRIVTASDPKAAAIKALMITCNGEVIDHMFYIDERGFRGPRNDNEPFIGDMLPDFSIPTIELDEEYDLIDEYFENTDDFNEEEFDVGFN